MRILFSAGGTGGHLYPALALADYIKDHDHNTEILFVGSKYRIEASKVEQHNYKFIGLDIKTPSGNVFKKIKGYYDVFSNVSNCVKIIESFKPDIVVGFGGYTSYSILKAAQKKGIPTLLHEQNSIVGKSNLALEKNVDGIISAYDISNQIKQAELYQLGNPTSYTVLLKQAANLSDYGLDCRLPTVLIVMGSQGSQTIDKVVNHMLQEGINYQVIYVCGPNYYENYKNMRLPRNIKIIAYTDELVSLIKACDLIVSRAGASAITEIISAHKPAIFIPSIHVTNNHQFHNVEEIIEQHAAILCEENSELEANLALQIERLMYDDSARLAMIAQTKKFSYEDAAPRIYELIMRKVGDVNEQ